jgi:hypothetical protein
MPSRAVLDSCGSAVSDLSRSGAGRRSNKELDLIIRGTWMLFHLLLTAGPDIVLDVFLLSDFWFCDILASDLFSFSTFFALLDLFRTPFR